LNRKIHRVYKLIACNYTWSFYPSDKCILLTSQDFVELCHKILTNNKIDSTDRFRFQSAVSRDVSTITNRRYRYLEKVFCKKLFKMIDNGSFDPTYRFEGQDSKNFIKDYLEIYMYIYRSISYDIKFVNDIDDYIINVSCYKKYPFLGRLPPMGNRLTHEFNFLESNITSISGRANNFTITIKDLNYNFTPKGVWQN